MEMFPESSRDHLSSCLTRHASAANAALSLSATSAMQSGDNDGDANLAEPAFSPPKIEDKPVCLSSLLEELSRNVSSKRVKPEVDEDDFLNDVKLDPKKKLRVVHNNQPAADTGGVTRQFFTRLLYLMSDEFFHGENYKSMAWQL